MTKDFMKFTLLSRTFQTSWSAILVYLVSVTLLCALGFWQLDRAKQKEQYLLKQREAINAESRNLNEQTIVDIDAARYHKVVISGSYDVAHQFLVDNQMVEGKIGYLVLTPFFLAGQQKAILVNRGWVQAGRDRKVLPDIGFQSKTTEVKGRVNHFPAVGYKLKGAEIPTDGWPSVVQVIDPKVLSNKLGYEIAQYQVELDPSEAHGFTRDWKLYVPVPPEKHLAYAVQWFGLALTLTLLFIWISIRNRSEHRT
ncbi:MAG: SURF1 family protein [Gammaproteobacteria bacterium]